MMKKFKSLIPLETLNDDLLYPGTEEIFNQEQSITSTTSFDLDKELESHYQIIKSKNKLVDYFDELAKYLIYSLAAGTPLKQKILTDVKDLKPNGKLKSVRLRRQTRNIIKKLALELGTTNSAVLNLMIKHADTINEEVYILRRDVAHDLWAAQRAAIDILIPAYQKAQSQLSHMDEIIRFAKTELKRTTSTADKYGSFIETQSFS